MAEYSCWAASCEHLAWAMPPVCYTSVHPTNISPELSLGLGLAMTDTLAQVRAAYDRYPEREWNRLVGGAQARLEYLITTHALQQHLPAPDPACYLLDAGGGPGRYTLALAA